MYQLNVGHGMFSKIKLNRDDFRFVCSWREAKTMSKSVFFFPGEVHWQVVKKIYVLCNDTFTQSLVKWSHIRGEDTFHDSKMVNTTS